MSFFKNPFKKDKPRPRTLTHPKDLIVGDMVKFDDSFLLPQDIRGELFKVDKVNTYEYEHDCEIEYVLKGVNQYPLFLTVMSDADKFLLSRELSREQVLGLFDEAEFQKIFDMGLNHALETNEHPELSSWVTQKYNKTTDAVMAYFHDGEKYLDTKPPQDEDSGEALQVYGLTSGDHKFGIGIEVFEDGSTDVCASITRPLQDIKELWPSEG